MLFPNAYRGIRRIYLAEILTLVMGIAAVITLLLAGTSLDPQQMEMLASGTAEAVQLDGKTMLLLLTASVSGILIIVAAVLNILGIVSAAKDEEGFRKAMIWLLISIIASFVGSGFEQTSGVMASFAGIIGSFCEFMVNYNVIAGIICLAEKLNHEGVIRAGRTSMRMLFISYAIVIILEFVMLFFVAKNGGTTEGISLVVSGAIAVVAAVVSLIAYVIYLRLLAKAKKMLAGGDNLPQPYPRQDV